MVEGRSFGGSWEPSEGCGVIHGVGGGGGGGVVGGVGVGGGPLT